MTTMSKGRRGRRDAAPPPVWICPVCGPRISDRQGQGVGQCKSYDRPGRRKQESPIEWTDTAVEGKAVSAQAMASDSVPRHGPGHVGKREIQREGREKRVEKEHPEGPPIASLEAEGHIRPARHRRVEAQAAIDQPGQDRRQHHSRDSADDRRNQGRNRKDDDPPDHDLAADQNLNTPRMIVEGAVSDCRIAEEIFLVPDLRPGRVDAEGDESTAGS